MKFTASQYARALYDLLEEHPADAQAIVKRFAQTLVTHGRASLLRQLITEFEREWYARKGVTPVSVVAAAAGSVPLPEIKKLISGEVEVTETVDAKLIAGARIRLGDWEIDNTVSRRMNELKRALHG